jgi:hypothetical protein
LLATIKDQKETTITMGQNFGTKMIVTNNASKEKELGQIINEIEKFFQKDKEGLTYAEFLDEKWDRGNEGLIGIYFNEKLIVIEDEYDLIKDEVFKNISEDLNTEVLIVNNSDTVGMSMITLYQGGELKRKKSFGLEDALDMLSGEEFQSVQGIGEPTIYEENGSDAISVFYRFREDRIDDSEPISITIYKEK